MLCSWFSKPEKYLKPILEKRGFLHNRFLKNNLFKTKTNKRQVDFLNKEEKIIIEFDGPKHFKFYKDELEFENTKNKDKIFNEVLCKKKYKIIRLSWDCWDQKRKKIKFWALRELSLALKESRECLIRIGAMYQLLK